MREGSQLKREYKPMTTINRAKLKTLHQHEESRFLADHPQSAALYQRAQSSLLGGVPMNWMKKWAGAFPIFVKSAKGAHFTDVDGREYIDLCLGDTGAEAEIDVVPAVDVGEVCAFGGLDEEGESAGPFFHPVHGDATEEGALGALVESGGVGMVGEEAGFFAFLERL